MPHTITTTPPPCIVQERMVDGTSIGIPTEAMAGAPSGDGESFGAVENRGVVPDVEVKVSPEEHARGGVDPCLAEALRRLAAAAKERRV